MKKKSMIIMIVVILVIVLIGYFIIKEIDKKSSEKYFNQEYVGATLLKITTNLEENKDWTNSKYKEKGIIVVDTCFNNTVSKKDYFLKLIEYEVVIDSINYFKINKTNTISNKQFEKLKNNINKIQHYDTGVQLKTPCYRVDTRNEESFVVIQDDLKNESLF